MTLLKMYDASVPVPLHGYDICAGYIGGDTPHVWTDAEWMAQPTRYGLPIFVRDHGGDPVADANTALHWLRGHHVPAGKRHALDFEDRIDSPYVSAYDARIVTGGYRTTLYGSESTVLANHRPSGGYWVARWDGVAELIDGAPMKQYENREPYDFSVVDPGIARELWVIKGGPVPPTPTPSPASLPIVRQGDSGEVVRTVQGLCNARHVNCAIDGQFGPLTDHAVRLVQDRAGDAIDGVVGPQTWTTLIDAGVA